MQADQANHTSSVSRAGTMAEVAGFLGVSRSTVKRLVAGGEMGSFRVGRQKRICEEELVAYVVRTKREVGRVKPGEAEEGVRRAWREYLSSRRDEPQRHTEKTLIEELVLRVERLERFLVMDGITQRRKDAKEAA